MRAPTTSILALTGTFTTILLLLVLLSSATPSTALSFSSKPPLLPLHKFTRQDRRELNERDDCSCHASSYTCCDGLSFCWDGCGKFENVEEPVVQTKDGGSAAGAGVKESGDGEETKVGNEKILVQEVEDVGTKAEMRR